MNKNNKKNRFGESSPAIYFVLLLLHLAATAFVIYSTRVGGVFTIHGHEIPATAFTGVFSMIASTAIILLVVFHKKLGFVTSIVLIVIQYPTMFFELILKHNLLSIPGMFTNLFTLMAAVIIYRSRKAVDTYQSNEVEMLKKQQKFSQHLFEQTATALVNAVDAKDEYSHGHSLRVAEYSEKIARMMGKSDEECYRIYYTALLHDVGKIGISNSIINKKGKLTKEEYEVIKQHPILGDRILSSVREYPYLSMGARFHHERYDGKGYPDGLKGEDIPEIARIISVADAYDAMSSNRSYRSAIPQQLVREEIIKGTGTQFDPEIAKVMQHIIDLDTDYKLKERTALEELAGKNELRCTDYRSEVSEGIVITPNITKIHLKYAPESAEGNEAGLPVIILFDSLDARVHDDDEAAKMLNYYEYCELRFDGDVRNSGAREIKTETVPGTQARDKENLQAGEALFDIEAVKYKDHVMITIDDGLRAYRTTIALPDSSRFAYIGLTGKNCFISDVSINRAEDQIGADYIPRIAEEVSYIKGPEGDIPNVQIDGYRLDATAGIPITDSLTITFHTRSLPTARLVWHCPYFVIFHSDDGTVNGDDYREYALIRLDGEGWKSNGSAENELAVKRNYDFAGWEYWKKENREGYYCTVTISRRGNIIVTATENFGINIKSTTVINDGMENVCIALTGDQCALTDIRIKEA